MKRALLTLAICGAFFAAAPAFAASTISGTVTRASTGAAIANMYMSATNITTHVASGVYTDAAGAFSFSTLTAGTYDVSSGWVLLDSTTVYIKKVIQVIVADGETKSSQNLALTARGKFVGHVYAADGVTPLANASMYLINAAGSASGSSSAVTSSDGSYVVTPAPTDTTLSAVGLYTFTVSSPGYFTTTFTSVSLTGDETSVTQDMRLNAASTVSGTIRDASGAAVSNAIVTLSKVAGSINYPGSYSATTNVSGAYTVNVYDTYPYNSSAVADYTVAVSKAGYVTKSSTLSITADGTTLTGKDYSLAAGLTYSGTIQTKSGAALGSAVVSMYKRNRTRSSTADFTSTTTSDGAYSFTSLPTGNYRVQITRSGYAMTVIDSLAVTASITGKVYKLDPGGTVTGRIYTGSATGIDGASISIYSVKGGKAVSFASATSDDTGYYTVSGLKVGSYKLRVYSVDYVNQTVNFTVKASTTTTKNVKMARAGSVEGYLKDASTGLPLAFTVVKVSGTAFSTTSDSNGYYALDGLQPGKRKIIAINYLYAVPKAITVTVTAKKIKSNVNFNLSPI